MVRYAGSPVCILHADMTLTRSKVNVNVRGLLLLMQFVHA